MVHTDDERFLKCFLVGIVLYGECSLFKSNLFHDSIVHKSIINSILNVHGVAYAFQGLSTLGPKDISSIAVAKLSVSDIVVVVQSVAG